MHNSVNLNLSRTYNPSGRQNALSYIKRLLSSRDTEAQNKACDYLIEVIGRYGKSSIESIPLMEYLLDNDITVFLCEATSNLDFSLFRTILQCLRLFWRERRFFAEEHAAHAMTAVLRALAHFADSGSNAAVDACLHFLYDLLTGVSNYQTTSPLSHQSTYSAVQLLACLKALAPRINTNTNTILCSASVLHALVSYQPDSLSMKGSTAKALLEVLNQWFTLLKGTLNHAMLVGDSSACGMFLVIICQLGINVLRLIKLLRHGSAKADFVQTILNDDQEISVLKQCTIEMSCYVQRVISELIMFAKENQKQISTEEYCLFLKFLLYFLRENAKSEVLYDLCDVLFSKGYLTMLPQVQIIRNDTTVRKISTLVLGEILKVLAEKYLNVKNTESEDDYTRDIHMGLLELQNGIEEPQTIGMQLQKSQPYSTLIYIYFHCQSSEHPEEAMGPVLPYLVEHILRLPKPFTPPSYIIKALWLVFAMSTISNGTLQSLDERVYLEKATHRLVRMLHPDPSIYYTHNPAILLWVFSSQGIPNFVRVHVLSQWLQIEDSLPEDLTMKPIVWELMLNILIQNKNPNITANCMAALHICLEEGDDQEKQEFAKLIWSSLPGVLSKTLIGYESEIDTNICYLLDIATTLFPPEIDSDTCLKIAVLITTTFVKNTGHSEVQTKYHYEFVCLKLSFCLMGIANNQNDTRVLMTYVNRAGYLASVLEATNSSDDRVACAALQLLSYVVHYFNKNEFQPNAIYQIQTHLVIKSLRRDISNERGESLLQLIYMVLSSGTRTPLVLSYDFGDQASLMQQCNALRALLFRIQVMLCCRCLFFSSCRSHTPYYCDPEVSHAIRVTILRPLRLLCQDGAKWRSVVSAYPCYGTKEPKNQQLAGWKTLSTMFHHAIVTKNDPKLVAILTSQPWTHILVQFQLTNQLSKEFLTFAYNWLTLLKITITKSQEENKIKIYRKSIITKTINLLKKNLLIEDDDLKEAKQKVLVVVNDIFDLFIHNVSWEI